MKRKIQTHIACITASVLLTTGCISSMPVLSPSESLAATESIVDFSNKLTAHSAPDGERFASLRFSADEQMLYRDDTAVGTEFEGFCVQNGKVMVKESLTLTAAERRNGKPGDGYIPFDKAAEIIGCEISEENGNYTVRSPFQSATLIVRADGEVSAYGAVSETDGYQNLHVMQYETAADAYAAYNLYLTDQTVEAVEPNRILYLASDSDSPFIEVDDRWGLDAIGADEYRTWLLSVKPDLPEIIVAVIDTGIYAEHSWFENRIAEGGTGFTEGEKGRVNDGNGHGTHCAGIICSSTLDNVKILPIKALTDEGYGSTLEIYCGMMYAVEQQADVVSMSFGGIGISPLLSDACAAFAANDIPAAVAAGNDAMDVMYHHPAAVDSVITVSALRHVYDIGYKTDTYYLADFSNFGAKIDFSAPGVNIESAAIYGPNSTTHKNGTSMATPYVAGCIADLLSFDDTYTTDEIYDILMQNAIDLGDAGYDESFGWGMVHLAELANNGPFCAAPTVSLDSGEYYGMQSLTLSCSTENADIYYTLDGTVPTVDTGILYDGTEILIEESCELHAIAVANGAVSPITVRNYEIGCWNPIIKTRGGEYDSAVEVTIYCGTKNASIYYTLDGTIPSASNGTLYTGAFMITESSILQAIAIFGKAESTVMTEYYCIGGVDIADALVIEDGVLVSYRGVSSSLYFDDLDITAIGDNAFRFNKTLTDISLPESVTEIGADAFAYCKSLRTVYAPGVTRIGIGAFRECEEMYMAHLGQLEEVPDYAFYYCEQLSSIYDNFAHVTSIGDYAFYECDWLGTIGIDWTEIVSIGDYAFAYAWFYDTVSLDSLEYLGIYAFCGAYGLSTVSLPDSMTVLPEGTFRSCSALSTISAPAVTEIGDYAMAFYTYDVIACGDLYSQITKVGDYAFSGYEFRTDVVFDNLTEIGQYAFHNTHAITMSFPVLHHIESEALSNVNCKILYLESVETIDAYAIALSGDLIIVVGDELNEIQDYAVNDNWYDLILAGPAGSPAQNYADSGDYMYYETPCVYWTNEGNYLSLQQYVPGSLTAYPLGFGLSLEWYAASDFTGSNPEYFQSGNELTLDAMESGVYFYFASAMDGGKEIVRSDVLWVEVIPTEIVDVLCEKDQMILIDWDQFDSDIIAYQFSPAEEDYYYFYLSENAGYMTVLDQNGELYHFNASFTLKAGDVCTVVIDRMDSHRWNALYISDHYLYTHLDSEIILEQNIFQYTGKEITPKFSAKCYSEYYEDDMYHQEEIPLTEGVDYVVCYEDNIEAGTAYVNVFCMGSHMCYLYDTFYIHRPITEDSSVSAYDITSRNAAIFSFTPKETDSYLIYTDYAEETLEQFINGDFSDSYQDTKLMIYDSGWNEIGYDDDGGADIFSAITLDLEAGETYYIQIIPWGDSVSASVTVTRKTNISISGYLDTDTYSYIYTGSPIMPEFMLYANGEPLAEGTDYEVYVANNVEVGIMNLIIVGIGDYCGILIQEFSIDYNMDAIMDAAIAIEPDVPFMLRGDQQFYRFDIERAGYYQLVPTDAEDSADYRGDCYTEYFNWWYEDHEWYCETVMTGDEQIAVLNTGEYYMILSQNEDAEREFVLETVETFRSLYDAEVIVEDAVYTGEAIIPEVSVYYNGIKLTEDVDYCVYYEEEMVSCGLYLIYIEGIGAYIDVSYASFSIIPDVSAGTIPLTGETQTVTVDTAGNSALYSWTPDAPEYCLWKDKLEYTEIYVYDADMQYIGSNTGSGLVYTEIYVEPGEQYYIFAAFGDKSMTGSFDFTLTPDYALLDYCDVEAETLMIFQNRAQVPEYVVKDGDTVLTEGVDYEIFYLGGNTDIGRAEICFVGKGHYIGYLTLSFYIHPTAWDAVEPNETVELIAEESVFMERGLPGTMTMFSFTAENSGTYYLELPNQYNAAVSAFVYDADGAIYPMERQTIYLEAGDTIHILCVTDWLESMFETYEEYTVMVSETAPSVYYWTEDGLCFYIEDGCAYLIDMDDSTGKVGINIPDEIYDPETGVSGFFAGISEGLYELLALTKTIYCEEDGLMAVYCAENGYCFAYADPKTAISGDVTGDGVVDIYDAWTLLRWMTEANGMQMTAQGYANADMNGDGIANMQDVKLILAYANENAVR